MRPKLALNEGVRDLADRIDPHALFLEVFADRRETALAPNARTLIAAKGRKVARRPIGVDPDRAGLEALSHGERSPDALGPHACRKAVPRVVGDLDRLFLVVERDHREDRAEDFLLRNAHLGLDLGEDGRLDEPSFSAFGTRGLTAAEHARGALAFGDFDVVEHLLELWPGRYRPDLSRVEQRVAHARGLAERNEFVDELVVDRTMDQCAGACDASLAGRGENARDNALDGVVDSGVLEHDIGRFAAKLERDRLDGPRGKLVDALSGAVAPSEGDLRDIRMSDKTFTDLRAKSRQDIHHTGRKAGFLEQASKLKRRHGREFR